MRGLCLVALGIGLFFLSAGQAAAIDERVRHACSGDYTAFCSQYAVGSEGLRQCMRRADKKLSPSCIDALVAAGEISGAEVKRRRAAAASAAQ
jgi:hypothetical protein